jgi:hypothetical protein
MSEYELLPPVEGDIKVGDVVLWQGFKKGNPDSTAAEYFRGCVHRTMPDDGHGRRFVMS